MYKLNNRYKILSPSGYVDFEGIHQLVKNSYVEIITNNNILKCSNDHRILSNDIFIEAEKIKIGHLIKTSDGIETVIDKKIIDKPIILYDPINVSGGDVYYSNNILSHNCSFLGSSNTLLTTETIEFLFATYQKAPIHIDLMGKFRIYEKPKPGCDYVIGVDSGKGTGGDSSVIQVLKMKSMKPIAYEQVAVYQNNTVDIYMFTDIVHRISVYYNNAYIMVENNAEGSTVVNKLWWDIETDKLVNTGSKQIDLGIRATKNTKPRAVMLLKKLIEDHSLKINDKETVEQLSSFIEDKGKFYGQNLHDDLVSGLQWATYITELDIFDETAKLKESVEEGKEVDVWGLLSDVNTITSDDFEFNGGLFSS